MTLNIAAINYATVGTYTVYPTAEHADEAVAYLQTDDNDWDYLVVLDPKGTGKAVIAVFDEEHHYLGLL
jgi:hypothetical protein